MKFLKGGLGWRINRTKDQRGFTLVEVLVSVSVMVMVMTAVVAGVSSSVKNTRYSKERAEATRRTQEVGEWIMALRDQHGWEGMRRLFPIPRLDYCLTSLPTTRSAIGSLPTSCGSQHALDGTNLRRSMRLTWLDSNRTLQVTVESRWYEGGEEQVNSQKLEMRKESR